WVTLCASSRPITDGVGLAQLAGLARLSPLVQRSGGAMRGGVVAENITKEFGATLVLDGLSLTVPPGARIGVVGPNGSGTSTLLRILSRMDEPTSGTVTCAGEVGYLPQEPERRRGETLLDFFARRTGVAAAAARMDALAAE